MLVTIGRHIVEAAVVIVACCVLRVNTALDAVPQCRNDVAAECCQNAVESVQPSNCNWNIIMPIMDKCIADATAGCSTYQINKWRKVLTDFNMTLYKTACASACPDPDQSAAVAEQCFTIVDTVTTFQYTALEDLIAYIIRILPIINQDACQLLGAAVDCLNIGTAGCSALMDKAYQRLEAVNVSVAIGSCNVSKVVTPTTSRPLAIFRSVSIPDTTPPPAVTFKPAILIGESSPGNMSSVWTALITVAAVVIFGIVVIIGVLLQRTIAYQREAKKLGRLLSNEQRPAKTEWRNVSTKIQPNAVTSDWPARPRRSNDLIYRAT